MTHSLVGRHDNPTLMKYNVSIFLLVKVFVEWPSNIRVDLNDSVGVGRMQVRTESTNLIFTKTELTNLSPRRGHVLCGQQRRVLSILWSSSTSTLSGFFPRDSSTGPSSTSLETGLKMATRLEIANSSHPPRYTKVYLLGPANFQHPKEKNA